MQGEVQAGQQLLERWGTRNDAIAQLESVIEEVSGPVISQASPNRGQEGVTITSITDCHGMSKQCLALQHRQSCMAVLLVPIGGHLSLSAVQAAY